MNRDIIQLKNKLDILNAIKEVKQNTNSSQACTHFKEVYDKSIIKSEKENSKKIISEVVNKIAAI